MTSAMSSGSVSRLVGMRRSEAQRHGSPDTSLCASDENDLASHRMPTSCLHHVID
jgi:hypothetical protein